jgi:alpha,alpha-trehalase
MTFRTFPGGLSHYGNHATPSQLKSFGKSVASRLPTMPAEAVARGRFVNHAIAVAESGWDFTPRWDDRCPEFASVDLNSLLYVTERVAGDLAKELGNGQEAMWRKRMETRRATMRRLLWSEKQGLFQDYDETNDRVSSFVSAASFFPLFCGVADADEAKKSAKTLLAALETPYGLDTAVAGPRRQTYQWDSPNMWPPLQWVAVKGLLASGQREAAVRLARKYVATVTRNFKASGQLWEKYNAATGTIEVRDEYEMPPMMGWTAGTFLACCEIAGY